MTANDMTKVREFVDILGLTEEPMGMLYTNEQPIEGVSPKPGTLPTVEDEAAQQVDWALLNANWTCVIGAIWRARKKGTVAYFDSEHFGCLGGAFYLGFLKPQLDTIAYYVSTGIPGRLEGEHYFESPEVSRNFFHTIDPRPRRLGSVSSSQSACLVKTRAPSWSSSFQGRRALQDSTS